MSNNLEKIECVSKTPNAEIDFSTLKDVEKYDDEYIHQLVYPLSELFDSIPQGGSIVDAWGDKVTVNKVGATLYILDIE